MKKNILVIAPHPDDEAIGCGGTLLGHAAAGDTVRVIFLTSGEKGCKGRPEAETARVRESEAAAAAKVLRIGRIEFWRLRDGAVRANASNVSRLRQMIAELRPARIFVPHPQEMHPDHTAAARIVRRAVHGDGRDGPEILTYEVWTPLSEMEHVEDISPVIGEKMEAIRAHASQCAIMRFDEATLGLNRYRGEMHSWPGGPYAEVFGRMRP